MQGPNSEDNNSPTEGAGENSEQNGNGYRRGGPARPPRNLDAIRRGNGNAALPEPGLDSGVAPEIGTVDGTEPRSPSKKKPNQPSEPNSERPSRRPPSLLRVLSLLSLFWLISAAVDRLWLLLDNGMPAWDQADYLNGAMNYWALWTQAGVGAAERFSPDWWTQFWLLAPKIPPLTYLATLPFFQLGSPSADTALLVQLFFSAVLLLSVYGLARCIFPRPVSARVGLWAVAICALLPGLARLRLEYLLDYPVAASVTFAWWMMTLWHGSRFGWRSPGGWLGAIATGLSLALAILVKQTAALFLLIPLLWVLATALIRLRGARLFQGGLALVITGFMLRPWILPNWLLILSSSKRATVDSAIKEGDPSLLSPEAWLYYLKQLPAQVSWPLLIAPVIGLLLYLLLRKRAPRKAAAPRVPYAFTRVSGPVTEPPSLTWVWPWVFILGAYFLASLNPNKDARYGLAYLPALSLLLARGMTFYPPRLRWLPKGAIVLSALLLLANLFPLPWLIAQPQAQAALQRASSNSIYPPAMGLQWPHPEIIQTMVQAEPYLQNTLGVLPSTPTINQHNISFFGAQQDFRVFGRQVGVREDQVAQDGRSLNWFLTKTGHQGSIPPSQPAMTQVVENGGEFILAGQWQHPDGGELRLFHRKQPWIMVEPSSANSDPGSQSQADSSGRNSATQAPLRLTSVELPRNASPNQPLPVTYRWVGPISAMQNGLVALTWEAIEAQPAGVGSVDAQSDSVSSQSDSSPQQFLSSPSFIEEADERALGEASTAEPGSIESGNVRRDRWFHDHTPGMGFLLASAQANQSSNQPQPVVQLQERLAMLPQAAPGQYQLTGQYIDRRTGQVYDLQVPEVLLTLDNITLEDSAVPMPELDWVTQLREWSRLMPQGPDALGPAFEEVARVNQYAPRQDYVTQAEVSLRYRLSQPSLSAAEERSLRYSLVLAEVLQQDVDGAIAALKPLTELDRDNPYVHAYLSFVNLYGLRPKAAQAALGPALALAPEQEIIQILDGVGGLMSGNLVKAIRVAQKLLSSAS